MANTDTGTTTGTTFESFPASSESDSSSSILTSPFAASKYEVHTEGVSATTVPADGATGTVVANNIMTLAMIQSVAPATGAYIVSRESKVSENLAVLSASLGTWEDADGGINPATVERNARTVVPKKLLVGHYQGQTVWAYLYKHSNDLHYRHIQLWAEPAKVAGTGIKPKLIPARLESSDEVTLIFPFKYSLGGSNDTRSTEHAAMYKFYFMMAGLVHENDLYDTSHPNNPTGTVKDKEGRILHTGVFAPWFAKGIGRIVQQKKADEAGRPLRRRNASKKARSKQTAADAARPTTHGADVSVENIGNDLMRSAHRNDHRDDQGCTRKLRRQRKLTQRASQLVDPVWRGSDIESSVERDSEGGKENQQPAAEMQTGCGMRMEVVEGSKSDTAPESFDRIPHGTIQSRRARGTAKARTARGMLTVDTKHQPRGSRSSTGSAHPITVVSEGTSNHSQSPPSSSSPTAPATSMHIGDPKFARYVDLHHRKMRTSARISKAKYNSLQSKTKIVELEKAVEKEKARLEKHEKKMHELSLWRQNEDMEMAQEEAKLTKAERKFVHDWTNNN